MKNTIFLLSFLFVAGFSVSSCKQKNNKKKAAATETVASAPTNTQKTDLTEMTFDRKQHTFGVVNEGEKVETSFSFTNTGKFPLQISQAQGSCGCTVPEYPKEAIAPGEKGEIKVVFDSNGRPGIQQKAVTLFANIEGEKTMLYIIGEVTPDPENEKLREQARAERAKQAGKQ